ncbi:MAG: NADH-quinone oxidoreductase subunit C [Betaproteobacteria bacterium]|nr:NADH-quinone oxidoreductase subunit C [Betaproteobacteria bacterium]
MASSLDRLAAAIAETLEGKVVSLTERLEELTLVVGASAWLEVAQTLRDDSRLRFEQLIDLAGIDYAQHGDGRWQGPRFAAVYHLLSVTHNWRLRVRVFAADDAWPVVPSVLPLWPAANWYEREAFDLYGILFENHPDLRRLLTDYGFVGHPFRKDFPLSGHVEMRYDPDERRVVYQPVSIEPRELVPRIVREENYGG